MAFSVLWLFLTGLWVGLQCVIVVFPNHTPLFCFLNMFVKRLSSICINEFAYLNGKTKYSNKIKNK